MLSKEQILSKSSLKKEEVEVKVWGGSVFISELTVAEFNKINSLMMGNTEIASEKKKLSLTIDKFAEVKVVTLSFGIVKEDGSKMFTKEEIENFGSSNEALEFLYKKITELNNPKK